MNRLDNKMYLASFLMVFFSYTSVQAFIMPTDPTDCTFNGSSVAEGTSVTAYQNSAVAFGQSCVSEARNCQAGQLSGSYQYASCAVGQPAACLFNGETVNHGDSVTGYTSSTVPFGQLCSSVSQARTCQNGVLSGSAQYSTCSINSARSCLFDGRTISHGDSILAYQESSSQFGGSCASESRVCNDGTLSGAFQFGSCTIDQPASCLFDGRTIAHGEAVNAFQSSAVSFGQTCVQQSRLCQNGTLSGSYSFSSCVSNQPASCSLNGTTINHNESVIAFQSSSVSYGQSCVSESRTCSNGQLSGTMTAASCAVDQPASCSWNNSVVASGASVTAYVQSQVPYGSQCVSEARVCTNGTLSGTASSPTCSVSAPPPVDPVVNCTLNGQTVNHGSSVTTYKDASVAYGQVCESQVRTCTQGQLSGTFTNQSCSVTPAASCSLNGKTIASGSSVTVFKASSVASGQTCQSEIRTCTNGVLSGSAVAESCVVQNPPPPSDGGSCQIKNLIWEFPDTCRGNCGKGVGYFKSRVSYDNGKTWTVLFKNKLPDELKEVWNYLIDKNGRNSCARPNVQYTASKNKGYLVMSSKQVDCTVCRIVEVEDDNSHHGQCHKDKNSSSKKVLKLKCGDIKKSHHGRDRDDSADSHDHEHDHSRRGR